MSIQGYGKFKTPFYEIKISDSTGKREVTLPHQVARLVEKVDIMESFMNTEGQDFGTITVSFFEGSREPASPDASLGTQGLYQVTSDGQNVDMQIAGSLTNRSGVITDLRFSGNNGITFLTAAEQKSGKIDTTTQLNVIDQKTTRAHKRENKSPVFLFQERNRIKVTWGYKEDPATKRSFVGQIILVQSEFTESGTRTTITAQEPSAFLDQIAPTKGIPFGQRVTTSKGNSIVVFNDIATDQILRDISSKAGMAVIISKNLPAPTVDKDKQKMWIAGESFTEFMNRLASMHHSTWKIAIDPKTGKETLVFIKKTDFEERTIISDKSLLTFKGPGSLIKNVNIRADFGGIIGNSQKNINREGEPGEETDKDGTSQLRQFKSSSTEKKEEWLDADPTQNNPVLAAKNMVNNVLGGEYTGVVENNPSDSKSTNSDTSSLRAADSAKLISLDFTTIGYTKLTPGVVELRGIGVRYSGKYRLITVTHTLDSTGYSTKCTGISHALAKGGVKVEDAPPGQDSDEKVLVQQFKDTRPTSETSPRDELDTLQGTK